MQDIVSLANEYWNLWLFIVFAGIVVWALRPTRQADAEMKHNANIPLEDDDIQPRKGA